MITVEISLGIIGVIIVLGFLGKVIFSKTGIPDMVWLLLFGLLIGSILRLADPAPFRAVSGFFAAIAIIIILFGGGIDMDIYKIFRGAPRAFLLAILSFLVCLTATMIAMTTIGYPVMHGVLMGAIIGGTSSAIVIPVVKKIEGLRDDTKIVLGVESAITDALCIIVAMVVMYMISPLAIGRADIGMAARSLASAFSVGTVIGLIVGLAWLPLMHKFREKEFSYVVTIAVLFLLYAAVSLVVGVGGSGAGALACLSFGVVLGNGKKIAKMLRYKEAFEISPMMRNFHSLISFFIRTFFFVFLGLMITVQNVNYILIGICLTILILVMRAIAVRAATMKTKFSAKDKKIMTVMIPRGLAAAVLAYLPLSQEYSIPNTDGFPDIVFTVILATAIISTIGVTLVQSKTKVKLKPKKRNGR